MAVTLKEAFDQFLTDHREGVKRSMMDEDDVCRNLRASSRVEEWDHDGPYGIQAGGIALLRATDPFSTWMDLRLLGTRTRKHFNHRRNWLYKAYSAAIDLAPNHRVGYYGPHGLDHVPGLVEWPEIGDRFDIGLSYYVYVEDAKQWKPSPPSGWYQTGSPGWHFYYRGYERGQLVLKEVTNCNLSVADDGSVVGLH